MLQTNNAVYRILAAPTPLYYETKLAHLSVNITFAVPCFASNHILVSLLFKQFRTTFQ